MYYFTSDQHFDHTNIIKHCNRPFVSVQEMNEKMVYEWNNRVNENDTVVVLGDFALSSLERLYYFLNLLKGTKILVKGNHDRHTTKNYIEAGFSRVFQKFSYEIDSWKFNLTHKPQNATKSDDAWNLCGHVHDKWKINLENKIVNVGVDQWEFKPITVDEIILFIFFAHTNTSTLV